MITGTFDRDEARIRLKVQGPRGERQIEAVIDTGYTGTLTLPVKLIKDLGLPWSTIERSTLADGSECVFDVFTASVLWDGRVRRILLDEAEIEPLIGMQLMKEYELRIQVRQGGRVTLKRLAR